MFGGWDIVEVEPLRVAGVGVGAHVSRGTVEGGGQLTEKSILGGCLVIITLRRKEEEKKEEEDMEEDMDEEEEEEEEDTWKVHVYLGRAGSE